jgi:hypothetical protein
MGTLLPGLVSMLVSIALSGLLVGVMHSIRVRWRKKFREPLLWGDAAPTGMGVPGTACRRHV